MIALLTSAGSLNVIRLNIKPADLVSLSFWMVLVAAAGLYAIVTLAPDWLALGDLAASEAENRRVETTLENQIAYLEQVRDSLTDEPGYATELAQLDIGDARPDENRLTVDESLRLAPQQAVAARTSAVPGEWATRPAVAAVAHNDTLRITLLLIAAVMVLFAFTALQESHAEGLARWGNRLRRR